MNDFKAIGRMLSLWVHRDMLPITLFAVAVVVMTYPIAFELREVIPSSGNDIYTAFWQKWWMVKSVSEGANPNFTPYLFSPEGLDVTFQPRRWSAFLAWIPLTLIFGDVAGYNVYVLLGLLASAYTTYLLVHYLTDNRGAAWLAGALFAFYPQHVNRALGQPNTGSVQWIPLFILVLTLAFSNLADRWKGADKISILSSLRLLSPAAIVLSFNAYISIKVWALSALFGSLYALLMAVVEGWWRRAGFWRDMLLFTLFGVILIVPIIYPFLGSGRLGQAIDQFQPETGADLYSLIIPAPERPPLVAPIVAEWLGMSESRWGGGTYYVGLTTIALVIVGFRYSLPGRPSRQPIWLLLFVIFWLLSLGTIIRIDTVRHPEIWTPYRLVGQVPLFQAIRQPKRFALVQVLPLAVLAGYGVAQISVWLRSRPQLSKALIILLSLLLLYELNEIPLDHKRARIPDFYSVLQSDGEPGAIIDLPMGRQPAKKYMFYQTVHERPIVEGVVARMPGGAYDRIQANPLLAAWRAAQPPACDYDMAQAVSDLQNAGFSYVIIHGKREELEAYFVGTSIHHRESGITVYRLADLGASLPCDG